VTQGKVKPCSSTQSCTERDVTAGVNVIAGGSGSATCIVKCPHSNLMCQASTVVFISPSECQDVQVSSLSVCLSLRLSLSVSLSLALSLSARVCVCVCLGIRRGGVGCSLEHRTQMLQCRCVSSCVSSFSGGRVRGRRGVSVSQDADGRHHITPPARLPTQRRRRSHAMLCDAMRK